MRLWKKHISLQSATDHVGSSTFITYENGQAYQLMLYLPYNASLFELKLYNRPKKYRFNGNVLAVETGLYYYSARYYDPRISLWYGVDPMAENAPDWIPYRYCFNNLIRFIDPNGQDWYQDKCSGEIQWIEGSGKQDGFIHRGAEYQSGRNLYTTTSDGKSPLSFDNALPNTEVCADRICEEPSSNTNSAISNLWNSPLARAVPDKVGISFSTSATAGVGTSNSLDFTWIT